jgi:hypothetical protein
MSNDVSISRREALKLGLGAGALMTLSRARAFALPSPWGYGEQTGALIQRPIPSSGEKLPIIGIGTAVIYQNPKPEEMPPLRDASSTRRRHMAAPSRSSATCSRS